MKTLCTTVVMMLLLTITLSAQTTDEIPEPERVLVVYELPTEEDSTSFKIKNHYVQKRNIPSSNQLGIELTDPSPYGCEFRQNGEEIVDLSLPGDGGWYYVKEEIADHIEQHLNINYYEGQILKDVIRYIVLCKGIPLKVRYSNQLGWEADSTIRNRVSVDALLPQGQPEKYQRVQKMVAVMDEEGFGSCTNTYACEAECPKGISITNIARMNRDYIPAKFKTEQIEI